MKHLSLLLSLALLGPATVSASAYAPIQDVVDASATELVSQGRALFDAGKHQEADPLFQKAYEKEPGNSDARFWMLRNWLPLGRINDVLNEADEMRGAGEKGPALDYLYGMAFHAKATGYLATGVDGGSIAMSFGDAVNFLARATEADPERFADAFYPLAEAAWHSQDLPRARTAAEEAKKRTPKDPNAHFLLGRIAMSQYTVAKGDGTAPEEVGLLLDLGLSSFQGATRALGKPTAASDISLMARAWVQIAYCQAWKEAHPELVDACSNALGWNPADVDFSWVQSVMTDNKEFVSCLADGADQYAKRYGAEHPGDATLRWWLGWAHFAELSYPDAEREFTNSVTKYKDYVNSWFFIALSRYHQKNYDGAIESFVRYWELAPTDAVKSMQGGQKQNLAILDYLVGVCARSSPVKNYEAGVLSEMQAEAAQDVDRYWNNVGLFYRDAGEALSRSGKKNADRAMKLYEG